MRPFYEFLREERQYCAVLAHLLMSRRDNVSKFVDLINRYLPETERFADDGEAEIYLEYAYLRDTWDALKAELRVEPRRNRATSYDAVNLKKREFVIDLLRRVPSLQGIAGSTLPETAMMWNEYFMGTAGRRIIREVASPALWSVAGLEEQFGGEPDVFYDLCRVKWSFRIKPDLVVLLPRQRPICVEAKMESGEGTYPTGSECAIVDRVMGERRRCGQFELQQFMFGTLLGTPCHPMVIAKIGDPGPEKPRLSWGEAFTSLDASKSIPFVQRFLESNESLLRSYAWHRIWNGG
jgi:hypothetical protein